MDNDILREANRLVERDFAILPTWGTVGGICSCPDGQGCSRAGKHPHARLAPHGWHSATRDKPTLERWFTTSPTPNLAISCEGLIVVDCDGEQGLADLQALVKKHGKLPNGPRAITGSGGLHVYYRKPEGLAVPNVSRHKGTSIDLRSDGGIVVAPPSRNGTGQYTWEIGPETPLPDPPAWLLEWIAGKPEETPTPSLVLTMGDSGRPGVVERARLYLQSLPPAISGQGGHAATLWAARCLVKGFRLGEADAWALLTEYNERCVPKWSEAELRHKLSEASTKPFDKADGWLLADSSPSPSPGFTFTMGSVGQCGVVQADDIESIELPSPTWPTLSDGALYGLPGEIVRTIEPHTEADPAGLLLQFLAMFGNACGRGPRYRIEGLHHHANLFVAMVGRTSSGRKGTSRSRVMELLRLADPSWCKACQISGIASGEALIATVAKRTGQIEGDEARGSDPRAMVNEGELVRLLKVMGRDGNTLSAILRDAWDTGDLEANSKTDPVKCEGAHVSIVAHITQGELLRTMKGSELSNGYANRFLWACVRRSKLLPDGGTGFDPTPLGRRVGVALERAHRIGEMIRSETARDLWHDAYPRLTAERPGIFGTVTSRAEAQTLRLSMIYALTDGSPVIEVAHLQAALALWSYCQESARLIFGDRPEDALQAKLLDLLEPAGSRGLTRTEIYNLLQRNTEARLIVQALAGLRELGLAHEETKPTGGRPEQRWYARGATH